MLRTRLLVIPIVLLVATTASGKLAFGDETKLGEAAFGDLHDDAPGIKRHIKADDLPPPTITEEWVANFPDQIEMPADAKPQLPPGFSCKMIASGLKSPRVIRVAPNGDLFVAESKANQVRVYRMGENGAKPEKEEIFAADLYQPYGIAFYPLGPEPEWIYMPWYYIGGNEDPRRKGERPDLASKVTVPDVLFQAHSAPLGITFYDGQNFPAEYRGDAFVTFHGSWNRGVRTGYKVVRVLFKDGKPTGEYEDFITGFVVSDKQVWGRPVGVAIAKDGALFMTEDGSGTIGRVTHKD